MKQKQSRRGFFKALAAIVAVPVVAKALPLPLPAVHPKQAEVFNGLRMLFYSFDVVDVTTHSSPLGRRELLPVNCRVEVYRGRVIRSSHDKWPRLGTDLLKVDLANYTGFPVVPNGGEVRVKVPEGAQGISKL